MSIASNKWYQNHRHKVANLRRLNRKKSKDSILCRICNNIIGIRGMPLHLRLHSMTMIQYVEQNIEDFKQYGWQWCSNCKKVPVKTTPNIKRVWASCSEECKKAMMSKTKKGKRTALGYKWTKDQKEKQSLIKKNQGLMIGELNIAKRPEVRKKISSTMKRKAKQSDYVNPMSGKTHSVESLKKIFKKRNMTTPERIVSTLLESHKIEFQSQFFITYENNTYSYDFKIKDKPIIIEVDGDYWHGGPGVKKHWHGVTTTIATDKIKDEIANKLGYTVIRLWESVLKSFPDILLKKLEEYESITTG